MENDILVPISHIEVFQKKLGKYYEQLPITEKSNDNCFQQILSSLRYNFSEEKLGLSLISQRIGMIIQNIFNDISLNISSDKGMKKIYKKLINTRNIFNNFFKYLDKKDELDEIDVMLNGCLMGCIDTIISNIDKEIILPDTEKSTERKDYNTETGDYDTKNEEDFYPNRGVNNYRKKPTQIGILLLNDGTEISTPVENESMYEEEYEPIVPYTRNFTNLHNSIYDVSSSDRTSTLQPEPVLVEIPDQNSEEVSRIEPVVAAVPSQNYTAHVEPVLVEIPEEQHIELPEVPENSFVGKLRSDSMHQTEDQDTRILCQE